MTKPVVEKWRGDDPNKAGTETRANSVMDRSHERQKLQPLDDSHDAEPKQKEKLLSSNLRSRMLCSKSVKGCLSSITP